jgi:hypothetical protein
MLIRVHLPTLMLVLSFSLVSGLTPLWPADAGWAQDGDDGDDDGDDGGDDNDDDDDDGGSSGGGGGGTGQDDDDDDKSDRPSTARRDEPGRPRRAAPAPVELPRFAPGEIVTLALTGADLGTLIARGYRVIEERPVPEIGVVSRRLAVPEGVSLEVAREEVRGLPSGTDADFNHYYRTEEASEAAACDGPHCPALEQIGWVDVTAPIGPCAADVAIGVIDTGINPDHDALAGARLEVHRLVPESLDPSRAIHGTAVVALLVGDSDSRSPGLLPDAQLVAVDAFHKSGGDERADVYSLTASMDFLANRGIRVINMSLAGPPNTVLERAITLLAARGVIIVAAVGNAGPRAEPGYPAAYPGVVGVTAVDRSGNVYRRAGQGMHVDLAAPGVEVWTAASVRGARPKTGTSFAAPFVTAAAASVLAAEPEISTEELLERLTTGARDLGTAGPDEVFGHGLVQAAPRCRPLPA